MGATMMTTTTTRAPRIVLGLAALLTALALTACGSEDAKYAPQAVTEASGFPVTISTKHGPVKVVSEPKRVVTLDFPSTDAVLALGVTPVAMAEVSYVPGDIQTWTKAALKGAAPELLSADTDIPLEKIAAPDPDLIVGTNAYNLVPVYSKLSKIAPVVTYRKGPGADPWQDATLLVGRALGREPRARKLVADIEARVAKAAADHPNFNGRTLTMFNYAEGQAYAISSTEDFSIRFLTTLGFRLPPAIERAEANDKQDDFGETRLPVSDEQIKLLDADVVLGTSSDSASSLKALVRRPLFQRLSAVKRGAFATLDIGSATSIAFPSVLSINDALENLVPLLDRLTR
jgi:iron complex transport system substrate-binding protein